MPVRPSSSLTRRLLLVMGAPMAGLALVLGIGGALTIDSIVESVNDRLLLASGRAIAETLVMDESGLTVDLPPFALGMLENDSRDNVYYSVRVGRQLVTGYGDLPPIVPKRPERHEASFAYAVYRGAPIRIVAIPRLVPHVGRPVVIQVAETLEARKLLRDRMRTGLALLEIVLLGSAALILPVAVRLGLVPLASLRRHMEGRSPDDFAPLPAAGVPHELRSLIAAFNGLLSRLEVTTQGMRRFTADASHQMRTPLTILRTHLSVLRASGTESERGQASLRDIEAATHRLQRLLTQLLALARAESAQGASAVPVEQVDLVELARQVAMEHAPLALRADVDLGFESKLASLHVPTAGGLAVELLSNLVDNAICYNHRGGGVLVEVERTPDGAVVRVEDDGPGIRPADREAVFTRFRRLDRDQSRAGSGLGLAIVKALADGIGATVSLGDRRDGGRGLLVEVRFPTGAV